MLANFFGKSKPINYVVITGLFFIYFSICLFYDYNIDPYFTNITLNYVSFFLLITWIFFFFNFILAKNNLTYDNSYGFLFYVVCLGFLPLSFLNLENLLLGLIILFFFRRVYSLQSPKTIFKKTFDASFWLGVSFILAPYTILFFILLYVAIFIYKRNKIQTLLIPFIGFSIPVFLFFTYCFWFDKVTVFTKLFDFSFSTEIKFLTSSKTLAPFSLVSTLCILSILFKSIRVFSVKNSFQKNWILILVNFVISFLVVLLSKTEGSCAVLLLLFPVSLILTNGFELIKRKFIGSFILIVLLVFSFSLFLM